MNAWRAIFEGSMPLKDDGETLKETREEYKICVETSPSCFSRPVLARRPQPQARLLINHVQGPHLPNTVLMRDKISITLPPTDPVHKLLQLVAVGRPVDLAGLVDAHLLERVRLLGLLLGILAHHLAGALLGDDEVVLDLDAVVDGREHEVDKDDLAGPPHLRALLRAGLDHCPMVHREDRPRQAEIRPAQPALNLADDIPGKSKLRAEVAVTLLTRRRPALQIRLDTLLRLDAEGTAHSHDGVGTDIHRRAAGEVVVEPDVVILSDEGGDQSAGVDICHAGAVDGGEEQPPGGAKEGVEGLHQHGGGAAVLLRVEKQRRAEEHFGLLGVGGAGLLEQDVLARGQGLEGPLEVQPVGRGDVDCVDFWVVQDR